MKIWKFIKIALGVIFSGILLLLLWTPAMHRNKSTGYVSFYWSGLSALFNEHEFGIFRNFYRETSYNGIDGPYVFHTSDSLILYNVDQNGQLVRSGARPGSTIKVLVPNESKDSFLVQIGNTQGLEKDTYPLPARLIALSDIEGNFNGLYSFLIQNKVMDENYNWTFGDGHVVFLGDFVDRGEHVTQVLWLIYKLEKEAIEHQGKVHYILGNHEVMNLQGNASYAGLKYVRAAQEISGKTPWDEAFRMLYSPDSELRTKNSIERIGDYIFVHGGISPGFQKFRVDLTEANDKIRNAIDQSSPYTDSLSNFLMGPTGPLWFRGMAADHKDQKKLSEAEFESILKELNAKKIMIGHTVVDDIETDHDARLVKLDVAHGHSKYSGKTKGILIENGILYKIDDKGTRVRL